MSSDSEHLHSLEASSEVAATADPVTEPADDAQLLPDRLCRAVADLLPVDGVAMSVYLGGDIAVPIGASDRGATVGEALQFTLRQGPCFESYETGTPVLVPDLDSQDSDAWSRWPAYAAELSRRTPYVEVFAYPLLTGGVVMGSVGLYRSSHGSPGDFHDVAGVVAQVGDRLLDADVVTDPEGDKAPRWLDSPAGLRRRQVWLAQGLTLQANDITPGQAIDLLRAQAFAADRLVDDLAADVAGGRVPVPVLGSE